MKNTSVKPMPGDGKTALLVIDVQQGLFGKGTPIHRAEELLANIGMLVERAQGAGVPVVYIQHNDKLGLVKNSPEWRLHEHLRPTGADYIVHKQHPNAFEDTSLTDVLQRLGVSRLAVCGLVTHGCVRATCVGALKLGYNVTLAADAHSSYSSQAAELIETWNAKLAALGAAVKPAAEILFLPG